MIATPLDPDQLDYLTAMRDLLATMPSSWPVDHAIGSLGTARLGEPFDWQHETRFLRDRLAEVERARQPTEPSNATSSPTA